MRYKSKGHEAEALQWQGPTGEVRFQVLQDWGAPVTFPDNRGLTLILGAGGTSRVVNPTDWIVRLESGGWCKLTDDEFRSQYESALDPSDPFPGFEHVSIDRVAFRRWQDGVWEWRHGGLTRAEAQAGGWTALYTVEVPA